MSKRLNKSSDFIENNSFSGKLFVKVCFSPRSRAKDLFVKQPRHCVMWLQNRLKEVRQYHCVIVWYIPSDLTLNPLLH